MKYALSDSCTVQSYKPRQEEIGDPGHSTVHLGTQWTSVCEQQQKEFSKNYVNVCSLHSTCRKASV